MNYVKLFAIVAVLLTAGAMGFRVGSWRQEAIDAPKIQELTTSIANFNASQAATERKAREAQAEEDKKLIEGMQASVQAYKMMADENEKQRNAANAKLATITKSLNEVRSHDKASDDFLGPIPAGVRNAILQQQPDPPAGSGDSPSGNP